MDATKAHGLELWLRRLKLRSALSERDEAIIRALPGHLLHVTRSQDFVRLREQVTAACLVVEGRAARFGQDLDGRRQFCALHIPGDVCDLHSVPLPVVSSPLQALGDVVIYQIPHAALRAASDDSATLARAFWRDCTVDAMILAETILNISRKSTIGRTAHFLCEASRRFATLGEDPLNFTLSMNQAHLADATGVTPVHMNRTLRQLRTEQLATVERGQVAILDLPRLERIGEFDDAYLHLRREGPAD